MTITQTLPLPGSLGDTPFFNSNSPEIVLRDGILLSTFPGEGKAFPEAHLSYPLSGRIDVFFHHITNASKMGSRNTIYLGLLVGNASNHAVQLQVLKAVSYATRPDAPFKELAQVSDNDDGQIYAGPGDRVALDLLLERKQSGWLEDAALAAGKSLLLFSLPLPTQSLLHPGNGRTGFLSLFCDGPIYLATLAAFGQAKGFSPELNEWTEILNTQSLVEPRDKTPTKPGAPGELIYGRVAGIAKGSNWRGTAINDIENECLSIAPGVSFSFPISSVIANTCGTNQVQAAPMLVRYPDTAYQAHGNYGAFYDIALPICNKSEDDIVVDLTFQSPLKDWHNQKSPQSSRQSTNAIVFRGTVKIEWFDSQKIRQRKLIHLVQRRGETTKSLIEFFLAPGQVQALNFSFFYPADCTPPQVLTISGRLPNTT